MGRCSRCASVGLGVMGVLLMIFITGLRIKYTIEITQERDELLSNYKTLTHERDQLLRNCSTLTHERDQLLHNYSTLMQEKEELQIKYTILTAKNNDKALTKTNNRFLNKVSCPSGWNVYSKCYLISSTKKPWSEARQVCQAMGADLVTIESEEEQVYINGLGRFVWIGLQRSGMSWSWVNGRPLSTGPVFWGRGQPNSNQEHCVLSSPNVQHPTSNWHDYPCGHKYRPICEKSAT